MKAQRSQGAPKNNGERKKSRVFSGRVQRANGPVNQKRLTSQKNRLENQYQAREFEFQNQHTNMRQKEQIDHDKRVMSNDKIK